MINLQAIFIANGSAAMILFFLMISAKRNIRNRMPDNKMFFLMVWFAFMQCVVESMSFITDGNTADGMRAVISLLNSILFINNILFAFTWAMYCEYKLVSDITQMRKTGRYLAIPAILIIIGAIVNLFTPVYFSLTDENVYYRTHWYIIPYVVTYFYLGYGMVRIYMNRNKGQKYLFMPAVLFLVPIIFGSVLQYIFYGLSLIWIGTAIALLSLYINVQNEMAYVDALSGLYNRQYMNKYLDIETKKMGQSKFLAGVMLDIDSFKSINDRFGHLTGDEAIKDAGKLLHKCMAEEGIAVRYAGDEFILLNVLDDVGDIRKLIEQIEKATEDFNSLGDKPYSITFSLGYSIYDRKKDTFDSFIDRIDSAMYEDKKKKKSTAAVR